MSSQSRLLIKKMHFIILIIFNVNQNLYNKAKSCVIVHNNRSLTAILVYAREKIYRLFFLLCTFNNDFQQYLSKHNEGLAYLNDLTSSELQKGSAMRFFYSLVCR
jgi:hypothetical protein